MRKKVEILLALTFLAWATQTLFHQWGYGAELPDVAVAQPADQWQTSQFVPANGGGAMNAGRFTSPATLELRSDAAIYGGEIKLRQIARWPDADSATFTGVADLVVSRFGGAASRSVSLDELKETLAGAGLNLAAIRFSGPVACAVRRADGRPDEQADLQKWIDSHTSATSAVAVESADAATAAQPSPTTRPVAVETPHDTPSEAALAAGDGECSPFHTLRDRLLQDLSQRLNLPVDSLAVTFDPKDKKMLGLSEPNFTFTLEPRRVRDLGQVEWQVTLSTPDGSQKASIVANARAWQDQLVTAKALAIKQVIRDADLTERRVLVDQTTTEPLLTRQQIVGQQTSRELRPGTVMTARLIDPVMLAASGQYVTVTYAQGGVRIKTVARAMEAGAYGQTIRVKNEATNDTFEVVLDGPQSGTVGAPAKLASIGNE